ncbi:FHA domain-containing protein [Sulfitobacter porphyrae]|uniref:FHA domain-containing protein n=1 Tax=Sulfitobacter porphyrae TaxID=1246864 RepID=A0ABW2BAS0_9RHOB
MTLRLVLENAPHAQAEREKIYNGGKLMIGRGDDADWQLVDPDMFVSRQHAILTEEDGRIMVTDASSGGLFIDNAANPLGATLPRWNRGCVCIWAILCCASKP